MLMCIEINNVIMGPYNYSAEEEAIGPLWHLLVLWSIYWSIPKLSLSPCCPRNIFASNMSLIHCCKLPLPLIPPFSGLAQAEIVLIFINIIRCFWFNQVEQVQCKSYTQGTADAGIQKKKPHSAGVAQQVRGTSKKIWICDVLALKKDPDLKHHISWPAELLWHLVNELVWPGWR